MVRSCSDGRVIASGTAPTSALSAQACQFRLGEPRATPTAPPISLRAHGCLRRQPAEAIARVIAAIDPGGPGRGPSQRGLGFSVGPDGAVPGALVGPGFSGRIEEAGASM